MTAPISHEARMRNLSNDIARMRSQAAQQTTERETAIREHGIAHPHSVQAGRRLSRTQSAHRSLVSRYRASHGHDLA